MPSSPAKAGDPVRLGLSIDHQRLWNTGSPGQVFKPGDDARFKPRKTLLELGCLGFECCFVRRRVKTRDIAEHSRSEFDPGAMLGAPQGIGRMQLMRLGLLKILQNDRGFENWDRADLQHWRLAERRNRDKPIRF